MSDTPRSLKKWEDGNKKANEGQREERQSGLCRTAGRMEGEELHNSALSEADTVTGVEQPGSIDRDTNNVAGRIPQLKKHAKTVRLVMVNTAEMRNMTEGDSELDLFGLYVPKKGRLTEDQRKHNRQQRKLHLVRLSSLYDDMFGPDPQVSSALNGSNGEWTNTDDSPKFGRQKRNQQAPQPKKKKPRPTREAQIAKNRTVRAMTFGPMPYQLSMCAAKYAKAISDPWSPDAAGCCIPTFPSRDSQKSTAWARATVTIGTNNIGFVAIAPCLANNLGCIYTSGAAFTGTQVNPNAVGVSTGTLNTPWSASSLLPPSTTAPAAIAGRIVSVGLSVQYTGTILNQGGLYYSLVHPNHGNMDTFSTAGFGSYKECVVERITGSKQWLVAYGIDAREVQYPHDDAAIDVYYPFSQGNQNIVSPTTGANIMAIMMTGVVGNTFEVELIQHMEFIGAQASPVATPTHSDARGFEIVSTAANRIAELRIANPKASTPSLMDRAIRSVTKDLVPVAFGRVGAKLLSVATDTLGG